MDVKNVAKALILQERMDIEGCSERLFSLLIYSAMK